MIVNTLLRVLNDAPNYVYFVETRVHMSLPSKQVMEPVKLHDRGEVMAYWVQGRKEWRDYFRWKKQLRKQGFMRMLPFTMASATLKAAMVRTKDIIITSTGVSLNGKFNAFTGESKKIQQVTIIEEASPKILHISYHDRANTRVTINEIYIPIPKGKLGEAVNVMRLLEKAL